MKIYTEVEITGVYFWLRDLYLITEKGTWLRFAPAPRGDKVYIFNVSSPMNPYELQHNPCEEVQHFEWKNGVKWGANKIVINSHGFIFNPTDFNKFKYWVLYHII